MARRKLEESTPSDYVATSSAGAAVGGYPPYESPQQLTRAFLASRNADGNLDVNSQQAHLRAQHTGIWPGVPHARRLFDDPANAGRLEAGRNRQP